MAQTLTGNNRKLIQVAGQLSRKDAGYCMARHAIRGNYCMAVDQLDCKILISSPELAAALNVSQLNFLP